MWPIFRTLWLTLIEVRVDDDFDQSGVWRSEQMCHIFVISVTELHIYWWWLAILDALTWIDIWRSGWLLRLGSWRLLRSAIVICSTGIWDIDQFLMRLAIEYYLVLLLYWFMLLKVTGKILLDRNIYIVLLFYRLYGNTVHIVIVTLILLLLLYHPSNRNNMDTDWSK